MRCRLATLSCMVVALSYCSEVSASASAAVVGGPPLTGRRRTDLAGAGSKSVRLWVGSPAGFWGSAKNNLTRQNELLANLSKLADVVDTISVPAFFLGDPQNHTLLSETGGLVPGESIGEFFEALHKQGLFKVEALIGDFYGQNSVGRYRYYWGEGRREFVTACAAAVKAQNLSGLNFDFEPSAASCNGTQFPPTCSTADDVLFVKLLDDVRAAINTASTDAHREAILKTVSVDTGQSSIAQTNHLNASTADQLITMNTYGDTKDFKIALPRDLERCGPARFSLGVCPGCTNGSMDIAERMGMATALGVRHVSWWSEPSLDDVAWWAAIRKWKTV